LDNRSIGVFDSGLGGLSVMRHLIDRFPNENFVYFGDTARLPYGTRSKETIIKYVKGDMAFIDTFQVKMVIVACGTASSVALPQLPKQLYPVYGIVQVSADAAVSATRNKKIGVIATETTIKSASFEQRIAEDDSGVEVYPVACPLLVPLVENGCIDDELAALGVEKYISQLRDKDIDTLILGCTHYPLLRGVIQKAVGNGVQLIDPGVETARFVERVLQSGEVEPAEERRGEHQYFVSDSVYNFSAMGSLLLGKDIAKQVRKIDIERY
jgi:glutamate racemase